MVTYVGIVKAEEMTENEFFEDSRMTGRKGYLVTFKDAYEMWLPSDVFLESFYTVDEAVQLLEQGV